MIEEGGIRLRRAEAADVAFLVALLNHDDVAPFLAASSARDAAEIAAEVARSLAEPGEFGRFVLEVERDGEWRSAGQLGFVLRNRRSRIASLERLALHPDHRGRGLATRADLLLQRHLFDDLGFHRLELEVYGFNEQGIRHAERIGFVREGVQRKAYLRDGEWVDGVLFGLVREDLER